MSETDFHVSTPEASTVRADLAEIHGGLPTGSGQLLWHMFLTTAAKYPTRDAIVAVARDPCTSISDFEASTRRWSYRELLSRVDAVAHRLGHLDYGGTGNSLVVVARNVAEWGLFFWVAAKLGMTFIPLDPAAKSDLGPLLSASAPELLVVEDEEMARAVEDWAAQSRAPIQAKIIISDTSRVGWMSLAQIEAEAHKLCQMDCQFDYLRAGGTGSNALIIFTSGTTGIPKACVHTHDNLMSQTHDYDPNPDPEFVDRWLIHTPVHHIFAINNALRAWRMGGAVILPSPTFSVQASLRAVVQEQCTIMSATPTLIRAMLAESSCPDVSQFKLSIITLASTMISVEDIQLCKQSLGCRHAIQAYGMSETGPVVSWCRSDLMLVDGFHPGVGKVLPGASIRICQPGTREILCVGDVGELHVSGSSVIDGYLSPEPKSSFYVEGGRRWLITGDQARVDEDGVVYILGRYKDLIIRGGENIDPAIIETAISSLSNIEVQVVGQADKVAGEVPVAVVKRPEDIPNSAILEKSRILGPKYTLGDIYDLSQLGFDEMPVTSLKKPRRQLLKAALSKFLEDREKEKQEREQIQESNSEQQILVEDLCAVWEELCGVRPQLRQDVHTFADSILLLQYCDRVFRLFQTPLYMQDIYEHNDVFSQSSLLLQRRSGNILMPRTEPVFSSGSQHVPERDILNKHIESCSAIISSLSTGTVPESVIVLRASQHRLVEGQRPSSYHIRLVYRIQKLSTARIMEALQTVVSKTPVLRSVFVKLADKGVWQQVLCGQGIIPNILHESETVETEDDVKRRLSQDPSSALKAPYAFRADVVRCLETSRHVVTLHFNHAAVDAMSLWSVLRNLDDVLRDRAAPLPEPVPYRLWSDLWQQNRYNALARNAVAELAGRLRGISRFPSALWPPRRAPGWMVGNDSDSPNRTARDAVRESVVWSGAWCSVAEEFRFPRRGRIVRLPDLDGALRATHGIAPDVLARCAIILLNVRQTRAPYAIFASWEAARAWPFVPAWMQPLLPPAMAVDGPTTQWRLNMYAAAADETVLAFLRRICDEERELAELNHAPWDDVKAALSEEAEVAEEASFRQGFVWDVTLGMSAQRGRRSNLKILEPVSRHDWPDCGIFWNAFMVDKENMYFIASWDTAQLNGDEVDHYCDRLAENLRALANPSNWDRLLKEVSP